MNNTKYIYWSNHLKIDWNRKKMLTNDFKKIKNQIQMDGYIMISNQHPINHKSNNVSKPNRFEPLINWSKTVSNLFIPRRFESETIHFIDSVYK